MSNDYQSNLRARWMAGEGVKELTTAVCILLFAVSGFLFINPENVAIYAEEGGISWQTMPFVYSGLLLALSLIYILQSLLKVRADMASPPAAITDPKELAEKKTVLFRRLASLGLLLGYVMLLRVFGFAIMTPLFLFALFRLYERGPWKGDAVISLVGGMLLWVLFIPVLHLNLKGDTFDPVTPFLTNALKAVGF